MQWIDFTSEDALQISGNDVAVVSRRHYPNAVCAHHRLLWQSNSTICDALCELYATLFKHKKNLWIDSYSVALFIWTYFYYTVFLLNDHFIANCILSPRLTHRQQSAVFECRTFLTVEQKKDCLQDSTWISYWQLIYQQVNLVFIFQSIHEENKPI